MFPGHRFRAFLPAASFALLAATSCPAPDVGDPPEADLAAADPEVVDLVTRTLEEVRRAPGSASARAKLGMVYEANGLIRAAGESYEQAIRLEPGDPRIWYHAATVRYRVGDAAGALEALDRTIELGEGYPPAFWRRGEWLLDAGGTEKELKAAEAAFRRAIEADEKDPAGWAGLARVMLRDGREEEAVDTLERLVAEHPRNTYLHYLLGTAYRRVGRIDRAQAELKLGQSAQKRWNDPWRDEVGAYHVGFSASIERAKGMIGAARFDEAIAALTVLRQQRPDNLPVLNNLSVALMRSGRVDDALDVLLKAQEAHPGYFPTQLNLSGAYERLGDMPRALHHAERAIEINPTLGQAHERRGVILLRLKRIEPAFEAFRTSLEYEPDDPQVQLLAGAAAGELGRWEESIRHLEQACRLNPDGLQPHLALAFSAIELGRLDQAREALDRAQRLAPQHPKVRELQTRLERAGGAS